MSGFIPTLPPQVVMPRSLYGAGPLLFTRFRAWWPGSAAGRSLRGRRAGSVARGVPTGHQRQQQRCHGRPQQQQPAPTGNNGSSPLFWCSILWKKLMGTSVLNVSTSLGSELIRAYAHSTPPSFGHSGKAGSCRHVDDAQFTSSTDGGFTALSWSSVLHHCHNRTEFYDRGGTWLPSPAQRQSARVCEPRDRDSSSVAGSRIQLRCSNAAPAFCDMARGRCRWR